jgi:hypothetical protein
LNITGLADVSDYACKTESERSTITGLDHQAHSFQIIQHHREQSAWALVAKVAEQAAMRDNGALMVRMERAGAA